MLRDKMLYIEAEVAKVPPSHKVTDIASRSVFIEAERFTNTGTHIARQESAGSAYNIKVTDFVPLVNVIQSQRAINRQLEY